MLTLKAVPIQNGTVAGVLQISNLRLDCHWQGREEYLPTTESVSSYKTMNLRSICLLSNLISSHVVLTPPNTVALDKHDKDKFKDAAAPGVLVPLGKIAKVRFPVMADL